MTPTTKKQLIVAGASLLGLLGVALLTARFLKNRKQTTTSGRRKEKQNERLEGRTVLLGEEGYVNVRRSPKIDNQGWLDRTHNLLVKVDQNPVGTVLKRVSAEDGYAWYHIRLNGTPQTGYVREDVVRLI